MALFVPADDFDLDSFIDDLGFELAERYRSAENELIQQLATRLWRDVQLQRLDPDLIVPGGLTAADRRNQNRILAELAIHRQRSLRELQGIALRIVEQLRAEDWARHLVDIAAEQGEAAAAARLGLASRLQATFQNGTANQAVGSLVMNLQSRLETLNNRITRYPQDAYQRIVSLSSPKTLLGVTTSLRQQQMTVQRFLAEGIDAFEDRGGRMWRIGSYAEMAGRTSVNRAFQDASVWRMAQSGIHLVTIVGSFDACKRCAPWIGKVLSTDGTPAGWIDLPHATKDTTSRVYVHGTVQQARNAGWGHPNDRCRFVSYLPGLAVPQQNFEYDAKADKERQKQRELEREVRSAKRDMVTAPDELSRKRAEREVREAQAALRAFTSKTGRLRQSYREQLHFADGK